MTDEPRTITLLYDVQLRRPGCALLQSVAGCSHHDLWKFFDAESWLTAPTPGMRRLTGTVEEWQRLSESDKKGKQS